MKISPHALPDAIARSWEICYGSAPTACAGGGVSDLDESELMSGSDRPIWFAGDLGDPIAGEIAGALPRDRTRRIHCPGDLPRPWPSVGELSPRVVVVHRAHLGGVDAERLARLKRRLGPERRVILCVGPHVRYADIERWSQWVDLVVPEAVAVETIARQVGSDDFGQPSPASGDRPTPHHGRTIAVVTTNGELRATWAAICRAGGYTVVEGRDLESLTGGLAAVWDVPVLELGWDDRIKTRARAGPVVAAIGFLDRTTRAVAHEAGASACLDLPCDLADLIRAVDGVSRLRRDPARPGIPASNLGPHPARRSRR